MLYINSTLTSTEVSFELYSESLWVEVNLYGKVNLMIGVCYRAPAISNIEEMNLFNTMREMAKKPSIIMGDFNFPDVNWSSMEAGPTGEAFMDLVQDSFLFQNVDRPTRSDNMLDLVFSSELDMVKELNVACPIANSDHCIITWYMLYDNAEFQTIKEAEQLFNYEKGNYKMMDQHLIAIDWDSMFGEWGH